MLARYDGADTGYTDCYTAETSVPVQLAEYIEAFYTSPIFKIERWILSVLLAKRSSDSHARELGLGNRESFSAWHVEDRDAKQILLSDFRGQTRSWLMVESLRETKSTRLYFGSAVIFPTRASGQTTGPSLAFRMLLGFHKIYSKALLSSALRALPAAVNRG